eukprot:snap_masked-scaffold_15-processed-gene-7.29-mRNA-1 protein AED:0.29 eAED:0.31 QI:0/0/0/1/1/1/2/0/933
MISFTRILLYLSYFQIILGVPLLSETPLDSKSATTLLRNWNLSCIIPLNTTKVAYIWCIPEDLVSHLSQLGALHAPFKDNNFLNVAHILDILTWRYSIDLILEENVTYMLTFEQVKMGANINFAGQRIAQISNQFLQHNFEITPKNKISHLEVIFDTEINTKGRFMAISGGWDWSPYSNIFSLGSNGQVPYFTKGMIGNVTVKKKEIFNIENFILSTKLKNKSKSCEIKGIIYSTCFPSENAVYLAVEKTSILGVLSGRKIKITQTDAIYEGCVDAEKKRVKIVFLAQVLLEEHAAFIWKPGQVNQLADLHIKLSFNFEKHQTVMKIIKRKTGVRTVDIDAETRRKTFLEINGKSFFMKGSNIVPPHILESEYLNNRDYFLKVIETVQAANMNTLRVYGGGTILPDFFYDLCDEKGIVILHDFPFVQKASGHFFQEDFEEVKEELRQISAKLVHHPSIVLLNLCNECDVNQADVKEILSKSISYLQTLTLSQILWPSSPSNGFRVDGNDIKILNFSREEQQNVEFHGPYYYGAGFPSVNGYSNVDEVILDQSIPPKIGEASMIKLVSEYGAVGGSSYSSFVPFLSEKFRSTSGNADQDTCFKKPVDEQRSNDNLCFGENVMAQRNYPCHNLVLKYFGNTAYELMLIVRNNSSTDEIFKLQLYYCQIAQMLLVKSTTETYLSMVSISGVLTWQLNDIWPTFGWGSLNSLKNNYSTWKPLQYQLKDLFSPLYTSILLSAGDELLLFLHNTNEGIQFPSIRFTAYFLDTLLGTRINVTKHTFSLKQRINLVKIGSIRDVGVSRNLFCVTVKGLDAKCHLLGFPKDIVLKKSDIKYKIFSSQHCLRNSCLEIALVSKQVVSLLYLETEVNGYFSDNILTLQPNKRQKILFYFRERAKNMKTLSQRFRESFYFHCLNEFSKYPEVKSRAVRGFQTAES